MGVDYTALIFVDGGTFKQGGNGTENSGHSVTLNSFYIGQYEMTYELWKEIDAWTKTQELAWNLGGAGKGVTTNDVFTDWEPATGISWYEAIVICNAYSEMQGLTPYYYSDTGYQNVYRNYSNNGYVYWNKSANGYRLPTESEWEYAAKGGKNKNAYTYSGSNNIDEVAWYKGLSGSETHPVGTKKPNTLDIYDMCGNVTEWCFTSYYDYSPDSQTNPNYVAFEYDFIKKPICRGGSYNDNAYSVIYRTTGSSQSDYVTDNYYGKYYIYGLRIARNAE